MLGEFGWDKLVVLGSMLELIELGELAFLQYYNIFNVKFTFFHGNLENLISI